MDRPVTRRELDLVLTQIVVHLRDSLDHIRDDVDARNVHVLALWMNMSRKAANTSIYQQSPSPYIPLQPLVSLITGLDIPDFPGSIRDMVQLSEGECKRILDHLQIPRAGLGLLHMIELLRHAIGY